jgi:hypothetical protein
MIPIRDTVPRRSAAFVTWLLIAVNVGVFVWEISMGAGAEREILRLAFVPARFLGRSGTGPPAPSQALSLLTSMFLHAGWLHVLGNMLYLYIFGDNVEDALGHVPFALFYGAGRPPRRPGVAERPRSSRWSAQRRCRGRRSALRALSAPVSSRRSRFVIVQAVEIPAFFFLPSFLLPASGALHPERRRASSGRRLGRTSEGSRRTRDALTSGRASRQVRS